MVDPKEVTSGNNPAAVDTAPAPDERGGGRVKVKKKSSLPKAAQAPIVYLVLLLGLMGQMLLNPIIAPLSREMGLQEWHIGATISISAVMVMLMSPLWGRVAQSRGAKPVLLITLIIAAVALACFAAVAYMGMHGVWVGPGVVIGTLLTRGLAYGFAIGGVQPTVQTHLVAFTNTEAERVKAIGGIGAVNGISSVIGGIAGGALAAVGGLMLPLYFMPILVALGIVLLLVAFKPAQRELGVNNNARSISYFDSRVLPFMISGLLLFIVFGFFVTIFGFLIQDWFQLEAQKTAGFTAAYLTLSSVCIIAAQAVIVPKLGWTSTQLLRRGLSIATVGMLLFSILGNLSLAVHPLVILATVLFSLGAGMAMPGYSAGPTMRIDANQQGSLAGLLNANNGLAYAVAPIGSTVLYGINHLLPLVVGTVLCLGAATFGFIHSELKK